MTAWSATSFAVPSPAPSAASTPVPSTAPSADCDHSVVTCAAPAARAATTTTPATTTDVTTPTDLDALAQQTAAGAKAVLQDTYGSWLDAPSFSAGADHGLGLQAMMLGLAAVGLALVAIWQGVRLMITRRGTVLVDLMRGLLIAGLVTAAGVAIIDSALLAGDQISAAVLARAFGDSDALVARMNAVLLSDQVTGRPPVLVLFFAMLVLVLGIAQAMFLVLRQIGIPVLGALLPVAAVGQAGPRWTQTWLTRTLSLVMAICVTKPVVVIVLAIGFAGPAPTSPTAMDATRGLVSLVIAVAVFPIALRLFAPAARTVVERGLELPTRGAPRSAAAGHGTPGEVSAVAHASWMANSHPSPTVVNNNGNGNAQQPNAPAPGVPGQATGAAAATLGAASVPPVVVVHEAMGRSERLIGQMTTRGNDR